MYLGNTCGHVNFLFICVCDFYNSEKRVLFVYNLFDLLYCITNEFPSWHHMFTFSSVFKDKFSLWTEHFLSLCDFQQLLRVWYWANLNIHSANLYTMTIARHSVVYAFGYDFGCESEGEYSPVYLHWVIQGQMMVTTHYWKTVTWDSSCHSIVHIYVSTFTLEVRICTRSLQTKLFSIFLQYQTSVWCGQIRFSLTPVLISVLKLYNSLLQFLVVIFQDTCTNFSLNIF